MKESSLTSSLSKVLDLCWVNKPLFNPSKLFFVPQRSSASTHRSSCCSPFVEMYHLFRGCFAPNPPNGSVNVTRWTISSVNLAKQSGLEPDVRLFDSPTSTHLLSCHSALPPHWQMRIPPHPTASCSAVPSPPSRHHIGGFLGSVAAWHQGPKKRFLNSCQLHRSAATPNNVHVFVQTLPSGLYHDYF